jgi:hypothetical protein
MALGNRRVAFQLCFFGASGLSIVVGKTPTWQGAATRRDYYPTAQGTKVRCPTEQYCPAVIIRGWAGTNVLDCKRLTLVTLCNGWKLTLDQSDGRRINPPPGVARRAADAWPDPVYLPCRITGTLGEEVIASGDTTTDIVDPVTLARLSSMPSLAPACFSAS